MNLLKLCVVLLLIHFVVCETDYISLMKSREGKVKPSTSNFVIMGETHIYLEKGIEKYSSSSSISSETIHHEAHIKPLNGIYSPDFDEKVRDIFNQELANA